MITPAYAITATERVLPRLALDFTTAVLDPRVTVTRALNTATCVNNSGYIASVNANLPRFDYSPTSVGVCRGLLVEESRANLLLQSQTFETASWTKTLSTVASDAANGPDNALTADKLIPNSGQTIGNTNVFQNITKAASAITYTYSVFGKSDGFDRILLRCQDSAGATNRANVTVNVTTGAIVAAAAAAGTFTNASANVVSYANGFFRVELTFTTGTDTFLRSIVIPFDSVATTGDGVKGVLLWGAQLEAGAFATSYIPTTTTSLTRNTDAVSMTGTNFSSWFNTSAGSFVARYSLLALITTSSQELLNMDDGTSTNVITVNANNTAGSISATATTAGAGQGFISIAGVAANTAQTIAYRYALNNSAIAFKGSAPVVDTTYNVPTGLNRIAIGSRTNTFGVINGHMQKFFYYPQSLTNAELTAFSK